jgi:hypothetical protein
MSAAGYGAVGRTLEPYAYFCIKNTYTLVKQTSVNADSQCKRDVAIFKSHNNSTLSTHHLKMINTNAPRDGESTCASLQVNPLP